MEHAEYNTVEDFVYNKSFQEWVLNNDPYSSKFWLNWMSYNPEKASLINYSRAIVDSLPTNKREAPEEEINEMIEKIIYNNPYLPLLPSGNPVTPRPTARVLIVSRRNWLSIFAIFILVVASTWYLITQSTQHNNPYKSFTAEYSHSLTEITNPSDSVRQVRLSDGSTVLLEGKSRLSYTREFLPDKRVVYVTGKAAFDIRKDASRPFLVYTQGSIVKAIGTSFEIDMQQGRKTIISVTSGYLLVRQRADITESSQNVAESLGTIVSPNQQLVVNESNRVQYKTVVKKPVVMSKTPGSMNFVRKPAADVFAALQNAYAIPVLFDRQDLSACRVTADITNESFFDQLQKVCAAIQATYEVIDGTVVVTGAGCK